MTLYSPYPDAEMATAFAQVWTGYFVGETVIGGTLRSVELFKLASSGSKLRFTQTTASPYFSDEGYFAGQTIGEISKKIRAGTLAIKDVPVEYVVINGNKLIVNTRSALALKRAGIPETQWNLINKTKDEKLLAKF